MTMEIFPSLFVADTKAQPCVSVRRRVGVGVTLQLRTSSMQSPVYLFGGGTSPSSRSGEDPRTRPHPLKQED